MQFKVKQSAAGLVLSRKAGGKPAGARGRCASAAFTLAEILVAMLIFSMVASGVIYGYIEANRTAEWSAMSLAAQSYASQGAEIVRAANWNPRAYPVTNGYGTGIELQTPYSTTNIYILDVPVTGSPISSNFNFFVTNYVSITEVQTNPMLEQIRSDAVWTFYMNKQPYTNTIILLRAPDQ